MQWDGPQFDIFVAEADGSNPVNVTNTPGFSEYYPSWSPKGQYIAYLGFVNQQFYQGDYYVMNANGSNPRRVTSVGDCWGTAAWSPDASLLAYSTHNCIFATELATGQVVNMTSGPDDYCPSWIR
jgi:Tol biopolymer transport system component